LVPHAKESRTPLEPCAESEVICSTPGTALMASSMGRVIICSMISGLELE
jgi:hypothetical protein